MTLLHILISMKVQREVLNITGGEYIMRLMLTLRMTAQVMATTEDINLQVQFLSIIDTTEAELMTNQESCQSLKNMMKMNIMLESLILI